MADPATVGQRVTVTPNGPYLVAGGIPLTRRRMVESELGEPLTWQTTAELDAADPTVLCRCGQSQNKPFCDGSHASSGFDGTETADPSTYDQRQTTYPATGIVMRDDRSICEHAGFCGNHVTNVWKMVAGADTEDTVKRALLMAMIERCPSGALTYRLAGDDADIEPSLRSAIGVVDDGPLFVTGSVTVERADGQPMEARNRVTLCRCGGSSNKPLCDGSHKKNGFTDS